MARFLSTPTLFAFLLLLSSLALGQEPQPEPKKIEQPKLDYSYCRFDSTTVALMDEHIFRPVRSKLAKSGMDPRFLPLYMTAMDVNFDNPEGEPTHKILYANDGQIYTSFVVLKRGEDGTFTTTWTTQQVPPAPHVKLRARDLNGDGRLDIIASARGGDPNYEAMNIFAFNDRGLGGELVSDSRSPYDPRATFGIACAVIDSLGHNGRPAIEVWHDDSTHAGADFIRVRLQYADSAHIFLPESVDTLKELPFWCSKRRPAATKP